MNAEIKIEAAIREMTEEQITAEAARLFPVTKEERAEIKRASMASFAQYEHQTVASFLTGDITRVTLNRLIQEYIQERISWRQHDRWAKLMLAQWDNHRKCWLALAREAQ